MYINLSNMMGKFEGFSHQFTIQYNVPFNYDENSPYGNSVEFVERVSTDKSHRYKYQLNPYITITTFVDKEAKSIILNRFAYYTWLDALELFIKRYNEQVDEIYKHNGYGEITFNKELANTISDRTYTGKSEIALIPSIYNDMDTCHTEPCIYLVFGDMQEPFPIKINNLKYIYNILKNNQIDQVAMQLLSLHFDYTNYKKKK